MTDELAEAIARVLKKRAEYWNKKIDEALNNPGELISINTYSDETLEANK